MLVTLRWMTAAVDVVVVTGIVAQAVDGDGKGVADAAREFAGGVGAVIREDHEELFRLGDAVSSMVVSLCSHRIRG